VIKALPAIWWPAAPAYPASRRGRMAPHRCAIPLLGHLPLRDQRLARVAGRPDVCLFCDPLARPCERQFLEKAFERMRGCIAHRPTRGFFVDIEHRRRAWRHSQSAIALRRQKTFPPSRTTLRRSPAMLSMSATALSNVSPTRTRSIRFTSRNSNSPARPGPAVRQQAGRVWPRSSQSLR
jgi:hypothetical protein